VAAAETRPFAPFEWMLALRYLRARRREGFISVIAGFSFIGIMLGVATLIIVMSVMNGFRQELFDKILGLNGHVIIRPLGRDFTDYSDTAQRLQAVAGVKAAIPVVEGQVLMTTPAASGGVYVRGIREADLRRLEGVSSKVVSGSLDGFDGGNGIAIGSRLASTLKVGVGGAVSLVSRAGGSASLPSDTATRVKRYPVRAIFEIGMAEYDMTIGFLPLEEAQKYLNLPDVAHVLEVFVDDPDNVDAMRRPLLTASGQDMLMTDWRERNASFHNMLQVQRDVLFLILTLIVLVAALNIISGLIMLVKDKGRDIAILRTMGATRGAMMRVFFVTGASIGIVGTLGGLLLGVLVSLNIDSIRQFLSWATARDLFPSTIYFLSYLPAKVDVGEVASIVIMAISLSMLATLYPSWRAARLEPVEALRYE
jgi:lipoprotein-releasing system permease protein